MRKARPRHGRAPARHRPPHAQHLWLQLIDDEAGRTLCSSSSKSLELAKGGNVAAAKAVGEDLGKKAVALGIKAACFDRGSVQVPRPRQGGRRRRPRRRAQVLGRAGDHRSTMRREIDYVAADGLT